MTKLYWTAYCHENRHVAIEHIAGIINSFGSVYDTKMFSDLAISFIIIVAENKVNMLYTALNEYVHLDEADPLNSDATRDAVLLLSLNFTHGTGKLSIEVPAVPG